MNRRRFFAYTAAGAASVAAGDMLLEPHGLEVTRRRIVLRRTHPRQTVRLVQISDLHLPAYGRHQARVARQTAQLSPDLILVTGDSIDDRRRLPALDEFMRALPRDVPKLAVTGNWEYWAGVEIAALARLYAKHGCRLLVNDSATVSVNGTRLCITGLDDLVGGKPDIARALRAASAVPDLILAHCPGHRDIVQLQSLMISGHTHGGQVRLPGWVPFIPEGSGEYLRGWYETSSGPLYVSRGLGTSMVPLRFNSIPELALLELVV